MMLRHRAQLISLAACNALLDFADHNNHVTLSGNLAAAVSLAREALTGKPPEHEGNGGTPA